MELRTCGNGDLELSVFGLGCWAFGGGDYWGDQDQGTVDKVVRRAIELGVNYFDTAEVYNDGRSEQSLGQALKGLPRDRLAIGSKVSPSNAAPDALRAACEASLMRLDTDFIDLYMIHWPIHGHSIRHFTDDESSIANPASTESALETMSELKAEGKIRHLGVSNFGVEQLKQVEATGTRIVVNELAYSLVSRAIEVGIQPYCREHGIGIVGYMPLMQGLLTGKYSNFDEIPAARTRTRHFSADRPGSRHGEAGAEVAMREALDAIREIADSLGLSMAETALRWCAANPDMTSVLAGARNLDQLEANAAALSQPLPQDAVQRLNEATDALLNELGVSPDYYEGRDKSRSK